MTGAKMMSQIIEQLFAMIIACYAIIWTSTFWKNFFNLGYVS